MSTFLAQKSNGGTVRVSIYNNGREKQYVDAGGNVYDEDQSGFGIIDTGVDVSPALYDTTGDSSSGGEGGTLIAQSVLGADAASISLSGLSLSAWTQVRLLSILRSVPGGTGSSGEWGKILYRFNDDAGANYVWAFLNHETSHNANGDAGWNNGMACGYMPGPNANTNYLGFQTVDLFNPGAASGYKGAIWQGGSPITIGGNGIVFSSEGTGFWKNTGAITKILAMENDGGNLKAGSRLILLGIA